MGHSANFFPQSRATSALSALLSPERLCSPHRNSIGHWLGVVEFPNLKGIEVLEKSVEIE
jgi:hypothetical protein